MSPRLHLAWVLVALSGCAAYQIGNQTLFPPDIHTVYVPMFESDSFRRNLGEKLTEAVCKQIELQTPYKVVGTPNADSVLTGRIVNDTKRVLIEDQYDDARDVEFNLQVVVTWADRKGGLIQNGAIPLPPNMVDLGRDVSIVPEYGESIASAEHEAIHRLSEQIVGLMEAPW